MAGHLCKFRRMYGQVTLDYMQTEDCFPLNASVPRVFSFMMMYAMYAKSSISCSQVSPDMIPKALPDTWSCCCRFHCRLWAWGPEVMRLWDTVSHNVKHVLDSSAGPRLLELPQLRLCWLWLWWFCWLCRLFRLPGIPLLPFRRLPRLFWLWWLRFCFCCFFWFCLVRFAWFVRLVPLPSLRWLFQLWLWQLWLWQLWLWLRLLQRLLRRFLRLGRPRLCRLCSWPCSRPCRSGTRRWPFWLHRPSRWRLNSRSFMEVPNKLWCRGNSQFKLQTLWSDKRHEEDNALSNEANPNNDSRTVSYNFLRCRLWSCLHMSKATTNTIFHHIWFWKSGSSKINLRLNKAAIQINWFLCPFNQTLCHRLRKPESTSELLQGISRTSWGMYRKT